VLLLSGGLGSGKTTFIQGLGAGLEVETDVSSPTFILVAEHVGTASDQPVRLYHVDLYRLSGDADELLAIGLDEYLDDPDAICAIEWPQRAAELLPEAWLLIEIEPIAETKRRIRLQAHGARYDEIVSALRTEAGRGRG
jgi:tRNA threonylcarbamoyladenosine biosynthesis protein TsaE